MIRRLKFTLVALFVLAGLVALWQYETSGVTCCTAHAQEPEEEEGNPGHKEPTQACSHTPKKNQVQCKCRRKCNPDGSSQESRACKSYCWRSFCTCPDPCA